MSLLGGFGWAVRVLSGDSPSGAGGGRYGAGMEKRGVVVGFASAVLAVGMAFGGMAIAQAAQPETPRAWLCVSEGAATGPCVWDAQSQGNGRGESFYLDADGNVTSLPQE